METRDKSGEHRSVHDCRCQVIDFAIGERNLTVGRRRESIQDVQGIRKTGGESAFCVGNRGRFRFNGDPRSKEVLFE